MVQLKVESWIWWSVVIVVAASRFTSRYMALGSLRRFQVDDICMLVVLGFYTTLIVAINIVRNTSSNLLEPGTDVNKFSAQDISERIYGSKLILVVEQCQCVTVWGAKACLLILYYRLTTLRRENIAIKILAGYVAFGFVFMEIFYFAVWCRPFYNYWAVPTPNVQCDAATNHLITNAVFNLSSDLAMIVIGLPMFLRMRLSLKKKVPLVGIFSLGIFVILAAILNKVYSWTQPFGSAWTYWYVRESSTALLVANLPFVWTVWRKVTGIKSSTKASTCNSAYVPGQAPKEGNRRHHSVLSGPDDDFFEAHGTDGDLEMGQHLSFHDMLRENNPASDKKDATPYTHPRLFYGTEAGQLKNSERFFSRTPTSENNGASGSSRGTETVAPTASTCPPSISSQASSAPLL
ncbi:Hypothetical protein R9X50_00620000 [Acrodontium crateriforme]|uniref:Rhodopsin domain-containing protein n=1 Tax=Acrodontium crateriforme TaxID=150365 RepID=A0AAQ3MAM6_9PEZI|nr:Hypothetical protein R9X50_00620000 [Acrodontium crateriforme]